MTAPADRLIDQTLRRSAPARAGADAGRRHSTPPSTTCAALPGRGRLVEGRARDQRDHGRRGPAAARVPRHPPSAETRGSGPLDPVAAARRRHLGDVPRRAGRPVDHGRGVGGAAARRRPGRRRAHARRPPSSSGPAAGWRAPGSSPGSGWRCSGCGRWDDLPDDAAGDDLPAAVVPAQHLRLGVLGPADDRAADRSSATLRPVRPLPFGIDELRTGAAAGAPRRPWTLAVAASSGSTGCCTATRGTRSARCGGSAMRRAAEWILARQEADGCWGGIQPPWVYSLLALHLLGYPLDHPAVRAGLAGLDGFTVREQTAGRAGAPAGGLPVAGLGHRARADRAARRGRAGRRPGRAARDRLAAGRGDPGRRRLVGAPAGLAPGGWAFEFANDLYPDTDDTAEVVLALRRVAAGHPEPARLRADHPRRRRGRGRAPRRGCHRPGVRARQPALSHALKRRRYHPPPPAFVVAVSLFVDADPASCARSSRSCVHVLQFHGSESPEYCSQFDRPYIRAVAMGGGDPGDSCVATAMPRPSCSTATAPGGQGGTGRSFDWARFPATAVAPILAGGLTPANVGQAVRELRPAAVDVVERDRVGAGDEGPCQNARLHRRGATCWRLNPDAERDRLPRGPDARGHFGPYGGRFVPETLMAPLAELEAAYAAAPARSRVPAPSSTRDLAHYAGRPTPLYLAERLTRALRRRADPPQARGPQPHRRAQDQQHPRPGAAGRAHGQAPHHRRDRRRPARRRHRHRRRAPRARVRGLHGRRGRRAPGAQRLPHEAAGREGGAGRRAARARSRTRSTRRCATGSPTSHDTYYIIGSVAGPASVSDDGARLPGGDRPRGARADAARSSAGCPTSLVACVGGGSNAIGLFHPFLDDRERADRRRRSGRARARERASTRPR